MKNILTVLGVVGLSISILVVAWLAASGQLAAAARPLDFNDKTRIADNRGNPAGWMNGEGYWPGVAGVDSTGQVLDSKVYTSSFRPGGASEPILMAWRYCRGLAGDQIEKARFQIRLTQTITWGDPMYEADAGTPPSQPNSCANGNTYKLVLEKPFVGWIRVDVVVWFSGNPYWVVSDDAEIRDGGATIESPSELQVFGVGDPVDIRVRLGWACSVSVDPRSPANTAAEGGGFSLDLESVAQGKSVAQWDLGCGSDGPAPATFSTDAKGAPLRYVVVAADFDNTGGVCRNDLILRLYNRLFQKDETDVKTIDLARVSKPPTPTITASRVDVRVGDPVTLTVNLPAGQSALEYSIVSEYEDGYSLFRDLHAKNGTFSITPNHAGDVTVTVSYTNAACGSSDPVSVKIHVRDPNNNELPPGALLAIALIVAVVAAVLLGAYVFVRTENPVPAIIAAIVPFLLVLILWATGVVR